MKTRARNRVRRIRAGLFPVLALAAAAASAQPDAEAVGKSVVEVLVLNADGERRRVGTGFAVAEGQVLTVAHLVRGEGRIAVAPAASDAELVARVVQTDDRTDLALLAVGGLDLPPLKLAQDGFAPGRLVYAAPSPGGADAGSPAPFALVPGAVGKHTEIPAEGAAPAVPLLEHNAMIPAAGYGAPLLNECGEVAGVNRGAPGVSAWRLRQGQAPEGVVHAVRVPALVQLAEGWQVPLAQSDEACRARAEVTAEALEQSQQELEAASEQAAQTGEQLEQTQEELETATAKVGEAEARVAEAEAQYEEAVRTGAAEAEALQESLDSARGELEASQNERDALEAQRADLEAQKSELETQKEDLEAQKAALEAQRAQEAAAQRTRLIILGAAAALLVLVVVAVALVAQRRRAADLARAREDAAQAQRAAREAQARTPEPPPSFPDCLLAGETGDGRSVSIKVPGGMLAGDGVVLGRSPRNATFLIDDETLSREHARLFGEDGSLYIEDLNATNGTRVNGSKLVPGRPARLGAADAVELGAVKLAVASA